MGPTGSGQPNTYAKTVAGTVVGVDARANTMLIEADRSVDPRYVDRAGRVELSFDDNTVVQYQGNRYRAVDLERGDQIRAQFREIGGRLWVDAVEVTYNSAGGSTGGGYGTQPGAADLVGVVMGIDTRARIIDLESARDRRVVRISYDERTRVDDNGRMYGIDALRRGDNVSVQARPAGNSWYAETIRINRASGGYSGGTTTPTYPDQGGYGNAADVVGYVGGVDLRNRTIEIDRPSYASGFNPNAGTSGAVRLRYDDATVVEFRGQRYAPDSLERGDRVEVDASRSGNELYARRIVVTRDVNNR